MTVDNCTTSSYTVVGVVCRDRKGLVYDLFRTLKDIHIRVAYAKVCAAAAFGCSHVQAALHVMGLLCSDVRRFHAPAGSTCLVSEVCVVNVPGSCARCACGGTWRRRICSWRRLMASALSGMSWHALPSPPAAQGASACAS